MGTLCFALMVAAAAVLAVRTIIKNKKSGKSVSCGGDCGRCSFRCGEKETDGSNQTD